MPTKIAVAPSLRKSSAASFERRDVDALLVEEARVADEDALALDRAERALAGGRVEVGGGAQRQLALLGGGDDRRGQGMLACPLHAGGEPQQLVLVEAARRHDAR